MKKTTGNQNGMVKIINQCQLITPVSFNTTARINAITVKLIVVFFFEMLILYSLTENHLKLL